MSKHESYVSFDTAKQLKAVGFDLECQAHYNKDGEFILRGYESDWNANATASINPDVEYYSAPTLAVAQKWLLETKHIAVYACPGFELVDKGDDTWRMMWQAAATDTDIEADEIPLGEPDESYPSYEEALEVCLQQCLTYIINKNERV